MSRVYQRMSKVQETGNIVHEGTTADCKSWMQAEIRRTVRRFLKIDFNRSTFAANCFNVSRNDVTEEQMNSPELFNFMYDYFTDYFFLEDSEKVHSIVPVPME